MRNMRNRALVCMASVLTLAAFGGCVADLEPAPSADRVIGLDGAAKTAVQGVAVLVQADAWPGPLDIETEVTPLKIRIDNNSADPLQVRYEAFTLVSPTGASFAALPLSQIEGEVSELTHTSGARDFYYRDFSVAPYYAPHYPGIDPYPGYFPLNSYYYDTYYHYWTDIELPTPAMQQRALPEGVIDSGGSLDGWLFFERVDDDLERVVFRADLVNADTGRKFAEVRIPFTVE